MTAFCGVGEWKGIAEVYGGDGRFLGNGVDLAAIRIVQAGLRGGLDEVERRRGVASLAASTASGSASARRRCFSARRRSRRRGSRCGTRRCSFLRRLGTPNSRSYANNSYQESNDDLTHCFSSPCCRLNHLIAAWFSR